MDHTKNKAACVLVFSKDGTKILAVSRKDNKDDFGIPGGKVDEGESFIDAAIRETLEETGFTINITDTAKNNPFISYDGKCEVRTFIATVKEDIPKKQINEEETGVVTYVRASVLFKGSFGSYNKQLLDFYDNLSTEIRTACS